MSITPIETSYHGYRFRSRLEARWAVFFDSLGVRYEYEKEGFDLGDGVRYLPDFWLPDHDCWVEIKPETPTADALQKPGLLAANTGKWVDVIYGGPWPGQFGLMALRSLKPEFRHPRLMPYIDLAFERGDLWMILAFYRAFPECWWGDIEERYARAHGQPQSIMNHWRTSTPPYRVGHYMLELCPSCHRLLFGGHPAHAALMPRVYYLEDEEGGEVVEEELEPFEFPYIPDLCPDCHVPGDAEHPRLIAAYTAGRQARFEHGAQGAPR